MQRDFLCRPNELKMTGSHQQEQSESTNRNSKRYNESTIHILKEYNERTSRAFKQFHERRNRDFKQFSESAARNLKQLKESTKRNLEQLNAQNLPNLQLLINDKIATISTVPGKSKEPLQAITTSNNKTAYFRYFAIILPIFAFMLIFRTTLDEHFITPLLKGVAELVYAVLCIFIGAAELVYALLSFYIAIFKLFASPINWLLDVD